MTIDVGATSQSINVKVVDDDGLPITGLEYDEMPEMYWLHTADIGDGNPITPVNLGDNGGTGAPYASGGVAGRTAGWYRLDVPNAAFATAGFVNIIGESVGKHLLCDTIEVRTNTATAVAAALAGQQITIHSAQTGSTIDVLKGESIQNGEGTAFTFTEAANETGWPTTLSSVTFFAKPTAAMLVEDGAAPYLPARFAISALSVSSTTATITCLAADRPAANDMVKLTGFIPAELNTYYQVAATPLSTTFTVTVPTGTATATTTGYGQIGLPCTVTSSTGSAQAFRLEFTKHQLGRLSTAIPWGYEWNAVANIATYPKGIRSGVMNTRG